MLHNLTIINYYLPLTLFYSDAAWRYVIIKLREVFAWRDKNYKDFFSVYVRPGADHVQCLCIDKHTHRLLQAEHRKNLRVLRVCLGIWRLH